MGTEIAICFSNLRAQLESEKSNLFKLDEHIKRIVQKSGRFIDRFNATGDYPRGGARPGGRNSHPDVANNSKNDDQLKRKHETKTVFSRLSARSQDSDGEEDGPKRSRISSAVCRELPTRAAVLRAQGDDEQARTRNRRIFGSLLGTLQKFKQEEIVLQTKEDKKAQVEKKIEEQARLEKEQAQKEKRTLFVEREFKKVTIRALEAKVARVQEFEEWEKSEKCLGNFILTKAKPHVYWLPKKMSEKAEEKLASSRKFNEKCMTRKREELQSELERIEQRIRRAKPSKENQELGDVNGAQDDEKKKRDKFAMDGDEKDKEESDGEERHDAEPVPVPLPTPDNKESLEIKIEETVPAPETEDKPIQEESKPIQDESKPIQEESKPIQEESKPTQEESKPTQVEIKPNQESKPNQDENKPTQEENKTTQEENKPTQEEIKPKDNDEENLNHS